MTTPSPGTPGLVSDLLARFAGRTAQIGIIGLGYVGLPLARAFSASGFPVLGFDTDPAKVAQLERGQSYIGHIPAQVIREMAAQRFEATHQFDRLREPDAIIICVPTPLTDTRDPDLSSVVNSAKAIHGQVRNCSPQAL